MQRMSEKFNWELRSKMPNADDQSVGQTYLELYLLKKDSGDQGDDDRPTQAQLDAILAGPAAVDGAG